MDRCKNFLRFYQIGAFLAVLVLIFAGCSNPAGGGEGPFFGEDLPTEQEVLMAALQDYLGCPITANKDGTFTLEGFKGLIPVSDPDSLPPELRDYLSPEDPPRLDLSMVEVGTSLTPDILGLPLTITKEEDDVFLLEFKLEPFGQYSYKLAMEGANYIVKPTDRQLLSNYAADFGTNLAKGGFEEDTENETWSILPQSYYIEEIELPLPDFKEGLKVGIKLNGKPLGEFIDKPVILPLAEGENTIVIEVSLGKEGPDEFTLLVPREEFYAVSDLTVSPEEKLLIFGGDIAGEDTVKIELEYGPENATNPSFDWTSSNEDVATVDEYGNVTATGVGSAVITVASVDIKLVEGEKVPIDTELCSKIEIEVQSGDTSFALFTVNGIDVIGQNFRIDFEFGINDIEVVYETNVTDSELTTVEWEGLGFDYVVPPKGETSGNFTATLKPGENKAAVRVTAQNDYSRADPNRYSKVYTLIVNSLPEGVIVVSSVELTETELTLARGGAAQLHWTVLPGDAWNKDVTWSSYPSGIVSVSSSGLVTALSTGTAVITLAPVQGYGTASCVVTVYEAVTGVTISPKPSSLNVGQIRQLTANVAPSSATNKDVTWSSNAAGVADVDDKGLLTARSTGTATITVTTADGGKTDSFVVTVSAVNVASVELNTYYLTLYVAEGKDSATLVARVLPSDATDKSVTWLSTNPDVAIVDKDGLVTAKSKGSAIITVTSVADNTKTAACNVSVIVPVSSVTITGGQHTLSVGGSTQLGAAVNPAGASDVRVNWSSSDKTTASVDQSGQVTALKVGDVTITAESNSDSAIKDTFAITVNPIKVTKVSLISSLILAPGGSYTLVPTFDPPDPTEKGVSWESSNGSVATVDADGTVKAIAEGKSTITVTTNDGSFTSECEVIISAITTSVTSVSISPKPMSLNVGATGQLNKTILPTGATVQTVIWSSSNTTVAAVDQYGLVTALSAGTATITATTAEGSKTDTCAVTVSNVPVSSVSLDVTTMTLPIGMTQRLTPTFTPVNATDKSVAWITSNSSVANVIDGVVIALKAGTATITVRTANGRTAACVVTVPLDTVPVTDVNIDPATLPTLTAGASSVKLTATVTPENATVDKVIWNSTSNVVASVDQSGNVTAHSAGDAIITVTTVDGSFTKSCAVHVIAATIGVTSVEINKTSTSLPVDATETLHAWVTPDNATNKGLSWSSSNESVATVVNGTVTAKAEGSVTITVRSDANSAAFRTCTVAVTAKPIPVTGVIRDVDENQTLNLGGTVGLSVQVLPADATNKAVNWSSSNNNYVVVDSAGNATAVGVGDATISATTVEGGHTVTFTITVPPVDVASVSIPPFLTLAPAGEFTLTPVFVPANATNQNVNWDSDNTAVATVVNGVVTAHTAGTATITVTTVDGARTATCVVTVMPLTDIVPVTSVTLNKPSLSVDVGATDSTLVPTVNPSGATVTAVIWSTSDPTVAIVDQNGSVTGLKAGNATITVKSAADTTKAASCTVTVKNLGVTGIGLVNTSITLPIDSTQKLIPVFTPVNATNQNVSWSSSDSNVASVGTDGVVKAIAAGTATITVTSAENTSLKATCAVTVLGDTIAVTGVTLDKTDFSLTAGTTSAALVPTVLPSTASVKTVIWNSDNPLVASVDSDGKVTAYMAGTATITAKTVDSGKMATCVVTVNPANVAVSGVALNRNTLTLTVGEGTETLFHSVQPNNATNQAVTWESSDSNVVSVDTDGVVTAKAAGTATITVTTVDGGKTAFCTVTVNAATVLVESVSLNKNTLSLTAGNTEQLNATLTPTNPTNPTLFWESSNTAVATVSNGLVTAIKGGTTIIKVITGDGGKTATCTVTVSDNTTIKFEWVEVGVSLSADPSSARVSKSMGEQATITAPAGYAYQWRVDGDLVSGETSETFTFDSAKYVVSEKAYQVSVMITIPSTGKIIGGDYIEITVTE